MKRDKKNEKREKITLITRGRRRTQSLALGIISSESGRVPGVRLESVIRCTAHMVRSSGENFINDEGTLPLGFELVLLLLWEA